VSSPACSQTIVPHLQTFTVPRGNAGILFEYALSPSNKVSDTTVGVAPDSIPPEWGSILSADSEWAGGERR
jgi:hypothetical protein